MGPCDLLCAGVFFLFIFYRYEGFFSDGLRGGGLGILTEIAVLRDHGKSYLVDWKENRATCLGRLTQTDGCVYVGMWVAGQKHGYGTLLVPETGFYSGEVPWGGWFILPVVCFLTLVPHFDFHA